MSKWNKPVLSEEFIKNEERRKQMIIEAARRRKEKMLYIQQQEQAAKKAQQQALERHRQQKQESYSKYLRNNLHDKYEAIKKDLKQNQGETTGVKKWNKNISSQCNPCQKAQLTHIKSSKEVVAEEYEQQWEEPKIKDWVSPKAEEQLICSRLLDSLDLDIGSVSREKEVNLLLKNAKNPKCEDNQIRDIIGYESNLFSSNETKLQIKANIKQPKKHSKQVDAQKIMVELRNKKEGKILHWAIEEQQQAQDLFSNCSSKVSQQRQKQTDTRFKKVLQPIMEKKIQKKLQTKIQTKIQTKAAKVAQKTSKSFSVEKNKRSVSREEKKVQPDRPQVSALKMSKNKTVNCFAQPPQHSKNKGLQNMQKKTTVHQGQSFVERDITQMTCEQRFGIDSFIKNELLEINEQEMKVQKQLKLIHQNCKGVVKGVESKYAIKTDYKHSCEVIGQNKGQNKKAVISANESGIEESIQRLDDYLIRKEVEKGDIMKEQISSISFKKSKINPLCDPFELHAQVLSFAQNISKTQIEGGYGEKYKEKKGTKKEKNNIAADKNQQQDVNNKKQELGQPPELFYQFETGNERIKVNEKLQKLLLQ